MKKLGVLGLFILVWFQSLGQVNNNVFVVPPYLQIGANPSSSTLNLLWQTSDSINSNFSIEYESASGWEKFKMSSFKLIDVKPIGRRRLYQATLNNLLAGKKFVYKVFNQGQLVFHSEGKALPVKGQSFRFVALGDIASGLQAASSISQKVYEENTNLVIITGDIVYDRGLLHEYDTRFWPVYNGEKGATIMRNTPVVAAPGNHDLEERNFSRSPDALSYYQVWDQPLNGPAMEEGGASYPLIIASDSARAQFYSIAGPRFPRMSNFSFNAGDVHLLFLDMDNYVDWTNDSLQRWVRDDLQQASQSWKFVFFHHPGFNSSIDHFAQQQSRLLAPLFEQNGVSLVFTGHVHNYQRTFPMHFKPDGNGFLLNSATTVASRGRLVNGAWKLDKKYDGVIQTKPNGVIYIITGAGGNDLYNPEQELDRDSWQPFTAKYFAQDHSYTLVDVDQKTIIVRQKNSKGIVVDEFKISKSYSIK